MYMCIYFEIGTFLRKCDDTNVLVNKLSKNISMATKGGGYVVVYKTPTYSGQSLSNGKDQLFSAKVWNFGTTFLNSLANICMATYSLHKYTY